MLTAWLMAMGLASHSGVAAQDMDNTDLTETEDESAPVMNDGEADGVVDGIVAKQHIKYKRHMAPAYVREANVMWSKIIWRMLDLREKKNQYLYFPTKAVDDRRSLSEVLCQGVLDGKFNAYSVNTENEFEKRLTMKEFYEKMGVDPESSLDSIPIENPETGAVEYKYVLGKDLEGTSIGDLMKLDEVKKMYLKEVWFFDRKYGMLKTRIIGLCPIAERVNEEGNRRDMIQLFWVYYPHAAQTLSEQEAFYSANNDAARPSLYDMLEQRQFGSYIFRESNVFNNRVIQVYAQGVQQNVEAERIQDSLFKEEHDMWEF